MESGDRGRSPGRLDTPLPPAAWLAGLAAIAAWVAVRIHRAGIARLDREQQFHLVRSLGRLDLRHALGGTFQQASPPGYGLFALPFHLLLHRGHGAWWSYEVACYASLPVLGAAVIVAARSLGRPARSPRELLLVATTVGAGTTVAGLTEALHPTDVLATALVLFAWAALVRRRLGWAVVLLGLGLFTKQWVIVPLAVLAVLHQGRERGRLLVGPLVVAAIGIAPFALAQAHDTFQAVSAPDVVANRTSLAGLLPLGSAALRTLEARILPLVVVAALCLWLEQRRLRFSPEVALAALAAAALVRPLLDPAGFVYYGAPGFVFLVLTAQTWRLPVGVLALTLVLTLTNHPALHVATRFEATVTTAVFTVGLGLAVAQLRSAVVARQREPEADPAV